MKLREFLSHIWFYDRARSGIEDALKNYVLPYKMSMCLFKDKSVPYNEDGLMVCNDPELTNVVVKAILFDNTIYRRVCIILYNRKNRRCYEVWIKFNTSDLNRFTIWNMTLDEEDVHRAIKGTYGKCCDVRVDEIMRLL